ncbi:MAG: hypothetical protein K0U78_20290 [Actinomycetia bacterium]|nr:hypothetical protein [Actinomycetes bacterium]
MPGEGIFLNPVGVGSAAASTAALAGEHAGAAGQAAAAGAVAPPGAEDISVMNSAKVTTYCAEVSAVMGTAAAQQALYSVANAAAGVITNVEDVASGAVINAVL